MQLKKVSLLTSTIVSLLILSSVQATTELQQPPAVREFITQGRNALEVFYNEIANPLPVIIKFTMVGCGPCKGIKPEFERMAKEFAGKAIFLEIDGIKYQEITRYCKVMSFPSFRIYQNGKKIEAINGSRHLPDVRKLVQKLTRSNEVLKNN